MWNFLNSNKEVLGKLREIKRLIMAIKETLEQHVVAVNVFSDQLAASILGVRQDIVDLKAQLVDASTPEEVKAILQPALDKLGAQAQALKDLDDENVPYIPPPPVE